MHLLLQCFTATWVFVELLQGHAHAFAFNPTVAITTFNERLQLGAYPEPTPLSHDFRDAHRVRQASVSKRTCGWINGNKADPVTCESQFICGTTQVSIVGCCKTTTGSALCADIFTTCYDYLGAICGTACQANLNNLVCISPTPYCVEYIYPSGSRGYGCGLSTRYTETVALTVNTNYGGGSLTGVAIGDTSTSSSSSSPVSSPSTTVPTSSSPSPSAPPPPSPGLSAGAIAGISVGSAAGVVLISLISCWMWMKRRPRSTETIQQYPAVGEIPRFVRNSDTTHGSPHGPEIHEFSTPGSPGHQPRWGYSGQQGPYTGPTIPEMDGGEHKNFKYLAPEYHHSRNAFH